MVVGVNVAAKAEWNQQGNQPSLQPYQNTPPPQGVQPLFPLRRITAYFHAFNTFNSAITIMSVQARLDQAFTSFTSDATQSSPLAHTGHFEAWEQCVLRSPLSDKPLNLSISPSQPVCKDAKFTSATFHPLPPLPPLSSSLDFAFQSFTFSPIHPSPCTSPRPSPLNLTPFKSEVTTRTHHTPTFQIPASLSHPNSPYVPWESPVRHEFIRPSTPTSMLSAYSRHSYSRDGARAPEPPESTHLRRTGRVLRKMSKSIHNIRHLLKSKMAKVVAPVRKRHLSIVDTSSIPCPSIRRVPSPSPSDAISLNSVNSNSLAQWLDKRRREATEWSRRSVTLDEYDRAGSWINLSNDLDSTHHMVSPSLSSRRSSVHTSIGLCS